MSGAIPPGTAASVPPATSPLDGGANNIGCAMLAKAFAKVNDCGDWSATAQASICGPPPQPLSSLALGPFALSGAAGDEAESKSCPRPARRQSSPSPPLASLARLGVEVPDSMGLGTRVVCCPLRLADPFALSVGHNLVSSLPSASAFNQYRLTTGPKFWCNNTARARFKPNSSSFAGVNKTTSGMSSSGAASSPSPPSPASVSFLTRRMVSPSWNHPSAGAPKNDASIVYVFVSPTSLATTTRPVPLLPFPMRQRQWPGQNSGVSMLNNFGNILTV
mmetsp:Transcript_8284/g.20905  ORF Transcript_8284/g.20905 Transcript_8284/m.20905 type:complete len:277 (+) Transcript_8284:1491-2321(+)